MTKSSYNYDNFDIPATVGSDVELYLKGTKTPRGGAEESLPFNQGFVYIQGKLNKYDEDADALFKYSNNPEDGANNRITVLDDGSGGEAQVTIPYEVFSSLSLYDTKVYVKCWWVDGSERPHAFRTGVISLSP